MKSACTLASLQHYRRHVIQLHHRGLAFYFGIAQLWTVPPHRAHELHATIVYSHPHTAAGGKYIYMLGRKMSFPERMLCPIPGGLAARHREAFAQYKDWLASENLAFRTSFQFGVIEVAVFQQGDLPRFFSFMFHQRLTFCAESYLQDLTILDTSTSGNLGLFPR